MTVPAVVSEDVERLQARVRELEHERKHLLAVIEILQELAGSLHIVDIMQAIARRLGEVFGLDRASIFLAERDAKTARLVASFEDPSIRNYVVDLERYPELRRALTDGETVYIPDVELDPTMAHLKGAFDTRNVRSITVVPITWRGASIGAIMLRTFRDGPAFSEADVRFCQVVASLTAKALRNAHRFGSLQRASSEQVERDRKAALERIALIAFLRRLLERYATSAEHLWAETLLARASDEELDRLTSVAMQVITEEARG